MDPQNTNGVNQNTEGQSAPGAGAEPRVDAETNNLIMGIISYLGPLVIVSYIVGKDNPSLKFHVKQGLVLFVIEVAVWILGMMFGFLWMLFQLVNLAVFILAIVGITNVAQKKEKPLPFVG
jgi:uncharacterized membrane protein